MRGVVTKLAQRTLPEVHAALALIAAFVAAASPAFDQRRAFRDLQDLAALGPRVSGSDGALRARTLIAERLRQAGIVAHEDPHESGLVNVIGERLGRSDAIVLVATHYDSLAPGPAANESASGAALLLELARALAGLELEASVWLVFFDGHETGLRGSRGLAARMEREGTLPRLRAIIVVERVGDTDLRLETSVLASKPLVSRALGAARPFEPPLLLDPRSTTYFEGDHLPFVRKGVREVLPLADLHYGPGAAPGLWTHTAGDDLRRVSAVSLGRAGALVRALIVEVASGSR